MARLREADENPDWRWEGERLAALHDRIESMRPAARTGLMTDAIFHDDP